MLLLHFLAPIFFYSFFPKLTQLDRLHKGFEEASEKMNLFELFKQKCQWSEQEVKNNVRVI